MLPTHTAPAAVSGRLQVTRVERCPLHEVFGDLRVQNNVALYDSAPYLPPVMGHCCIISVMLTRIKSSSSWVQDRCSSPTWPPAACRNMSGCRGGPTQRGKEGEGGVIECVSNFLQGTHAIFRMDPAPVLRIAHCRRDDSTQWAGG